MRKIIKKNNNLERIKNEFDEMIFFIHEIRRLCHETKPMVIELTILFLTIVGIITIIIAKLSL